MKYVKSALVFSIVLSACSSNDDDGNDNGMESNNMEQPPVFTENGVPERILGTWVLPCSIDNQIDNSTRYAINTFFFSDTELNFDQLFFTDSGCTVTDESDPYVSVFGTSVFGDLVTTTGGFEARELEQQLTSIETGDGTVTMYSGLSSYHIYVIQDDVLYITRGVVQESERGNTIGFDQGYIKQ